VESMPVSKLRQLLHEFGEPAKSRTKEGLLRQLAEAKRAAATAPSWAKASSQERYLGADPDGARRARLYAVCRWCGGSVQPPRRTFCSNSCSHQMALRARGSYARKCVQKRDDGCCAECGVEAGKAARAARAAAFKLGPSSTLAERQEAAVGVLLQEPSWSKLVPHFRLTSRRGRPMAGSLWQMDHIMAVSQGGGRCGLDNLRTLCSPCHAKVTKTQSVDRNRKRRAAAESAVSIAEGDVALSQCSAASSGLHSGSDAFLSQCSKTSISNAESDLDSSQNSVISTSLHFSNSRSRSRSISGSSRGGSNKRDSGLSEGSCKSRAQHSTDDSHELEACNHKGDSTVEVSTGRTPDSFPSQPSNLGSRWAKAVLRVPCATACHNVTEEKDTAGHIWWGKRLITVQQPIDVD